MMSEKRFKLSKYATPSSVSYFCDENGRMLNKEVVKVLNEQQAIIRRDEMSIKTMMSNMEKLEEENEQLRKENVFLAYWKRKAMTLLMQVRRLTPRMTDKEVREFSKELEDE